MTQCNTSVMRSIAHARKVLERSQTGFASDCRCSVSTIRFREYGLRGVPDALAEKLSQKHGFLKASLIQNDIGPCVMFDGTVATKQTVKAWKSVKPKRPSIEPLSNRASRLMKQLVLEAASDGAFQYRNLLADFSAMIVKYGNRDNAIPWRGETEFEVGGVKK